MCWWRSRLRRAARSGKGWHGLADDRGRVLQVGHLERFNPAVIALEKAVTTPLFFEVHRMSMFTPRSLDIDVVLDLMIHDLDIVLHLTGALPEEIRAAGISVLSTKGRYCECAAGVRQRVYGESDCQPGFD